MSNRSVEERVSVVEVELSALGDRVDEGFRQIGGDLRTLAKSLSDNRPPIPFKEIVVTIVSCLAILGYVGWVASFFVEAKMKENAPQVELLEYRVKQLEATLNMVRLAARPAP